MRFQQQLLSHQKRAHAADCKAVKLALQGAAKCQHRGRDGPCKSCKSRNGFGPLPDLPGGLSGCGCKDSIGQLRHSAYGHHYRYHYRLCCYCRKPQAGSHTSSSNDASTWLASAWQRALRWLPAVCKSEVISRRRGMCRMHWHDDSHLPFAGAEQMSVHEFAGHISDVQ